ncbi:MULTISPECIES: hypothetical protein [Mesorhizobium]
MVGPEELESAADRIADMSGAELQIILCRAALMLRNVSGVPLEPATEDALSSIAAEMKIRRSNLIGIVLREWLETNALMSAVKVWNAGGRPIRGTAAHSDDRVWVEAELKDVGDQALMRGLATAFPIVRPGLFLSYCGRRSICRPQSV